MINFANQAQGIILALIIGGVLGALFRCWMNDQRKKKKAGEANLEAQEAELQQIHEIALQGTAKAVSQREQQKRYNQSLKRRRK